MRFINIAAGSLAEIETQLMIAANLGYVAQDKLTTLLEQAGQIGRMTNGLYSALQKKLDSDPEPLTSSLQPLVI